MSPVELVHERMERARLKRLRKAIGVTGLEIDDGRPGAGPGLITAACLVAAAVLAVVGVLL